LPGPVCAEEADRLATRHGKARVVHHLAAAIGLAQPMCHQPAATTGFGKQARRHRLGAADTLFRRAILDVARPPDE
jgi:hypothetical protein